jgi:hypothetical protein
VRDALNAFDRLVESAVRERVFDDTELEVPIASLGGEDLFE